MFLGRIDGKVWATIKEKKLEGIQLHIMQPVDEYEQNVGDPMVVVDTLGATEGDLVYWVNSTEASFVMEDSLIPSEASVVGLVERLDVGKN
jgi:ethanolamine utilization protein EutN